MERYDGNVEGIAKDLLGIYGKKELPLLEPESLKEPSKDSKTKEVHNEAETAKDKSNDLGESKMKKEDNSQSHIQRGTL